MADLHIVRTHNLGLREARKIAFKWAEQVEEEFDMSCTYEEGKTLDEVCFTRSGIEGTLHITGDRFELDARLGFLVGAFKSVIEREIVKNLDDLLSTEPTSTKRADRKK